MWGLFYPSGSWRYRLTIGVDTPEGIKTGSSVIQVGVSTQPQLTPETVNSVGWQGEAVAVDLIGRGLLFILLSDPDSKSSPQSLVYRMYPFKHSNGNPGGETTPEGIAFYSSLFSTGEGGKREVPIDALPMMVRFRDINDPKTVELVDPNDLVKRFGEGVRFKSATIEMVDPGFWPLTMFGITGELVTSQIEQRLSWLGEYFDRKLDGSRYRDMQKTNDIANSLSSGNFTTER